MSLAAEPDRHTEYKDVKGPTRRLGEAGGKLFCLFGNFLDFFWVFLSGMAGT